MSHHRLVAIQLLAILGLVLSANLQAEPARLRGLPYYEIFSEKDVKDATECHFITSAPDGTLFLCKETGIFTFDGTNWKLLLPTPATSDKIRCLTWTEKGIFAAGYQRIGLIELSSDGNIYFDAFNKAPLSIDTGDAYNWVNRIGDDLYFTGTSNISRVNIHTKEITVIETSPYIRATAVIGNALFVSNSDFGLGKLAGDHVEYSTEYRHFVGKNLITGFAPSKSDEILFSTLSGEVYRTSIATLGKVAPKLIHQNEEEISSIERLSNGQFALAIPRAGINVIDRDGNLIDSLDKSFDHRLSGIDALHTDRYGTLWSVSPNSVIKSLFNYPLTRIDERNRPNLHYPLGFEWDEHVFILNEGRLYKNEDVPPGRPVNFTEAIPGLDKSISAAIVKGNDFYLIADQQLYRFSNDGLIQLGYTGRVERLAFWNNDQSYLLGTSPSEIKLFKIQENGIESVTTLKHSVGLINKIAQTGDGVFWFEIGIGSVMRVTIDGESISAKLYDSASGIPKDWFAVWQHGPEVFFTERSGIYAFDSTTERFTLSNRFDEYFPPNSGPIHRVATDGAGNIWASYKSGNYILWNQGNGNYQMESSSLAQMGANFANQFLYLDNGDTLILTSNEALHVEAEKLDITKNQQPVSPTLVGIANAAANQSFYANLGYQSISDQSDLPAASRSLTFAISNTFSLTTSKPEFQFFLEGFSEDWTRWDQQNQISFNNLDHGAYVLKTRSRLSPSSPIQETDTPFTIAPTFWETPFAYLLYVLSGLATLALMYRLLSRNLKSANEKLEKMVHERTREIERKNAELNENATKLQDALTELRRAQDELMNTSRKAGMAEVATNVLHNVGNVLNSINVGVASLGNHIQEERISKLVKISEIIRVNQDNLAEFLQNDKRGKALPTYLERLANVLLDDFQRCQIEIDCMDENIEHVKRIITTQQSHAKVVDVSQDFDLDELIDSAIHITIGDTDHALFEIYREVEPGLRLYTDKHRVLQMITNFIKNAKESIVEANVPLGLISINASTSPSRKSVRIQITDNGLGISQENLEKIFQHGFTTKEEGHGFGMHSCANSAKALGGELTIDSEGVRKGATVTLELPHKPPTNRISKSSDRLDSEMEPNPMHN